MKRVFIVVSATAFWVAALALPAFAKYPPKGIETPLVLPQVNPAPATAFTGSNTIAMIVASLILLLVGTAALAAARKLRRSGAA